MPKHKFIHRVTCFDTLKPGTRIALAYVFSGRETPRDNQGGYTVVSVTPDTIVIQATRKIHGGYVMTPSKKEQVLYYRGSKYSVWTWIRNTQCPYNT